MTVVYFAITMAVMMPLFMWAAMGFLSVLDLQSPHKAKIPNKTIENQRTIIVTPGSKGYWLFMFICWPMVLVASIVRWFNPRHYNGS
jgi:hypothetical protein